jgi:hypothetical protein
LKKVKENNIKMNQQEHIAFGKCIKSMKHTAVLNQLYEFAAFVRDTEKDLTIPTMSFDQTTDWVRVGSLDPYQYYDRIVRMVDKYTTDKIDSKLREDLKELHDVIMRPVVRQELISKILGEDEQK